MFDLASIGKRWAPCSNAFVALCLFFGVGLSGQAAIFIKIEGVPGEAKPSGREDWIEVIGLGAESTDDGNGSLELLKAGELVVRKRIDKSSPLLMQGILKGQVFPSLQLEITGAIGVETCYRLRSVRVSGHRLISQESDPELVEEYRFEFDVAEWHDFQGTPDGVAYVGSTWNFATNEGGLLDGHEFMAPDIDPIEPVSVTAGELFEVVVSFTDPAQVPENLVFTALPSSKGMVKVRSVSGTGLRRTLSLEAGQLENGSDQLTLSITDGTRSSTRLLPIIVEGDRTSYEAYVEGFFGEAGAENPAILRPLEDPDGDDLSNIMEFFLGTNPALATPRQRAFTIRSQKGTQGTELKLRYFRRVDASGLSEHFEGSSDLGKWGDLGAQTEPSLQVIQLSDPVNGYVPMEATVRGAPDAENYFMRISVRGSLQ